MRTLFVAVSVFSVSFALADSGGITGLPDTGSSALLLVISCVGLIVGKRYLGKR